MFDLREVDEGLLGKDGVRAYAEDFGIFRLKLAVIVVRTGRLKVLDSGRAEIEHVKIDQDIFPPQAAELELPAFGAFELEVRRLFTHLHSASRERRPKEEKSQEHRSHGGSFHLFHVELLLLSKTPAQRDSFKGAKFIPGLALRVNP
jgi:hypothetical protein